MEFSFLTGCARQFWQITSGVCRAVGACLGGGGKPATLPEGLVTEAYRRVALAQSRFLALMERVRTGRQRGGWPLALVERRPRRASVRLGIVLPRRFGWLVALVGYEAAGRGSQLSHLLGNPEMVTLMADVPQARRILAPLCRMLGVACDGLRAAPRARAERVVGAKRVRAGAAAAPAVPPRFGYVPSAKWPRGVISPGVISPGVVRLKPG
jgi:hypothetical protein